MAGFRVYSSNSLDALFEELAAKLTGPSSSLFRPELITVQSRGMRRWLYLKTADRFGISGGYEFLFPNDLMGGLFTAALKSEGLEASGERYIDKERDLWKLMALVKDSASRPGFQEISGYLEGPGSGLRLYQLSSRLIDLFDQYITYRPDMISEWDAGKDDHWQASLWRSLTADKGGAHPPALQKKFFKMIKTGSPEIYEALPSRIFIFGIPALPQFHTSTLMALAEAVEVNMYFLNPSPHYWGDIKSYREAGRLKQRGGFAEPEDLHIDTGNPLLASMGRLLRDYTGYLLDRDIEYTDPVLFTEPEGDSLLKMIQRDIYDLRDSTRPGEVRVLDPESDSGDRSLTIHSCHGRLREMEVLRDYLLDRFNSDPSLKPSDIVVISPDIEEFAPYIHAVFGSISGPSRIPYDLVDRRLTTEDETVRALLALFELARGRCTAPEVADLLAFSPVREAFDLTQSSSMTIKEWIAELNIRWGLDPNDREHHGFGGFEANTWRAGLERLILGYAAPDITGADFAGVTPFGGIEGERALSAGNLLEFISAVSQWVSFMRGVRPPAEWAGGLTPLFDRLLGLSTAGGPGREAVNRALAALASREEISLEGRVVEAFFTENLDSGRTPGEFITGSLVFCSLLPMRSIPFRIICLAGMNDGAFPRISRAPEFDLMTAAPRPGDRSLRDEDRFLFLETLISARDALYISYTGQSISDNSPIPPSVVVSELLDYIDGAFRDKKGSPFRAEAITFHHKLQPFSPAYFGSDPRLFSYSKENLAASIASGKERRAVPFFIKSSPGEPRSEIDLSDLKRFIRNPSKFFISSAAGISLYGGGVRLQSEEPFDLSSIERASIGSAVVDELLLGGDPETIRVRASRQGALPGGAPGKALFEDILREALTLAERVRNLTAAGAPHRLEGRVHCGGITVSGALDLYSGTLVRYRFSKENPGRRLEAWVDHLFAGLLAPPVETRLEFRDSSEVISPAEDPLRSLTELAALFTEGLTRPLEFFPNASWAFCQALNSGKERAVALEAAREKWEGNPARGISGEGSDPWNALAFRDRSPFEGGFADMAIKVCLPLMKVSG